MSKKSYLKLPVLYYLILFPVYIMGQPNDWKVFNKLNSPLPSNRIESVSADKDGVIWLGTDCGLVRFNGKNWNVYDTINSALPSLFVSSILTEGENIWIGTTNGLVIFNGSNWILPPAQDSLFISKNIISIIKDKSGDIWVAGELAIVRFPSGSFKGTRELEAIGSFLSITEDNDGVIWIGDFNYASHNGILCEYNKSRWSYHKLNDYDELISSFPYSLVADKENNIWMGFGGTTGGGVVKINNSGWQIYKEGSMDYPGGVPLSFAVQDSLLWMGSSEGLILYNSHAWSILDNTNSGLPGNWIRDLAIDRNGNKWIGTISDGAAIYNENGIVTQVEPPQNTVLKFELSNYPNPFNPQTTINVNLPEDSYVNVNIYNISGELVTKVFEGKQSQGLNEIVFSADGLSSGFYICRATATGWSTANRYQHSIKIMYLK